MSGPRTSRRSLRKNQRGATAVEFALIAPILFAILFVAIEVIVMLFADATLEATANRVTRIGKIGVPEHMDCTDAVKSQVHDALAPWARGGHIYLDVQIYEPGADDNWFQDIDEEGYEPICDAGDRGEIVMYRMGFEQPKLTGILSWLGIDLVRLERFVMIQNEP